MKFRLLVEKSKVSLLATLIANMACLELTGKEVLIK